MKQQPKRIGDLLPGLLARWRLDVAYRVNALWPQVAGDAIARVTRPQGLRQQVLLVDVQHPSWAQELALLRADFLARYRKLLPDIPIADIRFQARAWYEPQLATAGPVPAEARPSVPDLLALSPEEQAAVERELSETPESIREAMRRLLLHEARLAKTRVANGWRPCAACGALFAEEGDCCQQCRLLLPPPPGASKVQK